MRPAHKYAKEISHWLNGGKIEYLREISNTWEDYNAIPNDAVYFLEKTQYRIKSEKNGDV